MNSAVSYSFVQKNWVDIDTFSYRWYTLKEYNTNCLISLYCGFKRTKPSFTLLKRHDDENLEGDLSMKNTTQKKAQYEINDKPPPLQLLVLSLQHVLLYFPSAIAVPLIIAGALEMSQENTVVLMQSCFFLAGLATAVQAFGIGKFGAKLPILTGATFNFLTPCIAISLEFGFATFLGSALVAGAIITLMIIFSMKLLIKLFPPIVMACVIIATGLSLLTVSTGNMAGVAGSPGYDSWPNYLVAFITVACVVCFNVFGTGLLKGISILMAMIIGTVVSGFFGMLDFSSMSTSAWFSAPQLMYFGMEFNVSAILICLLIYGVTVAEFIGDTTTASLATQGRVPTEGELKRGLTVCGLSSMTAALFGSTPLVTFSGNVGLLKLTGIKSRFIVGTAGIIIAASGFIPKIATAFTLIPGPVMGGATLAIFGIIATAGIELLMREKLTQRDLLIVALSLAVGIGFEYSQGPLTTYPYYIPVLFQGIAGATLTSVILHQILPRKTASELLAEKMELENALPEKQEDNQKQEESGH